MPTKKITLNNIKTLNRGEALWDTETKGFGCRMQSEARVFVLKYRIGTGRGARQYIYTIGKLGSPWTPDSARDEAKRLLGIVAQGGNPAANRQHEKLASDVNEAFSQFIEQSHGKRGARTRDEYKRMFDKYVTKDIGANRLKDVTKPDIRRILNRLSKAPIQANRLLQMLKAFFSWCEGEKYRDAHTNPCGGINKHKEKSRERYLSEQELQDLSTALTTYEEEQRYIKPMKHQKKAPEPEINAITPYVTAAIRLLILSGARRDEILSLQWSHVDFERKQLRLPESKTGEKVIQLNAPALQLLSEIPRIKGNPYVICGKKEGTHLVNIKDPWQKIRKNAGLDDVRIHDLRHNFASIGLASGLHLKVIGTLLGHSQIKTTERYAHLANDPLQTANEVIGKRILDAMNKKTDQKNIVSIN